MVSPASPYLAEKANEVGRAFCRNYVYLYEWLVLHAWISLYYFHTTSSQSPIGYRAVGQTLPAPMDEYREYSGESRGFSDGTLKSSVVWGKKCDSGHSQIESRKIKTQMKSSRSKAHILLLYLFDMELNSIFLSLYRYRVFQHTNYS